MNAKTTFYVKDMLTTTAAVNAWARGVIGNRQDVYAEWDEILFGIWATQEKRFWVLLHIYDAIDDEDRPSGYRLSVSDTGDFGLQSELAALLSELPEAEAQPAPAERAGNAPKPWEIIPDVGWNRKAVELWHAGYTAGEIARMIDRGLAPKTISNVISNLRGIYGTEVVPERRAKARPRRKLG